MLELAASEFGIPSQDCALFPCSVSQPGGFVRGLSRLTDIQVCFVCVCTYVCMYVCMVCIHICVWICVHVCMCTCIHVCMCIYILQTSVLFPCSELQPIRPHTPSLCSTTTMINTRYTHKSCRFNETPPQALYILSTSKPQL